MSCYNYWKVLRVFDSYTDVSDGEKIDLFWTV